MYNLETISLKLIDQISTILDSFTIVHTIYDRHISMACPIHGGDNPTGLSILLEDIGNWQCFTHNCHEKYDSSILGFIEALLSVQYTRSVTRREAIEWSARFVGENQEYNKNSQEIEKTQFIHLCQYINPNPKVESIFIPRKLVRRSLQIPALYFIQRGYSKAILLEYDIGFCNNPQKSMYNRVIVPFYDENGEYMIGCSGRSIFPKCSTCNLYHKDTFRCPITQKEKQQSSKWKHNHTFCADSYLYNYWKAKSHIEKSGFVILVEGPGDIWRLEEAGIHYGLALLGAKLTNTQREILEKMRILRLIVATDNNEAGNKARKIIEQKCKRLFNIHHIYLTKNDIGDTAIDEIHTLFDPILKDVKERNHVL